MKLAQIGTEVFLNTTKLGFEGRHARDVQRLQEVGAHREEELDVDVVGSAELPEAPLVMRRVVVHREQYSSSGGESLFPSHSSCVLYDLWKQQGQGPDVAVAGGGRTEHDDVEELDVRLG